MGNQIKRTVGTQICFADHTTDFSPTAANDLTQGVPNEVQIDTTSLADAAARQSDKADLGEQRAPAYTVMCALELAATPTAGDYVEFYWAASPDPTAGNGNPGGCSGADAAYAGYNANLGEGIKHLQFIGNHVCSDDPTAYIQISLVGVFSPACRYGSLVIKNESAAAFHSDAVETHVVFIPIYDEVE